jgi:hypothetical protein
MDYGTVRAQFATFSGSEQCLIAVFKTRPGQRLALLTRNRRKPADLHGPVQTEMAKASSLRHFSGVGADQYTPAMAVLRALMSAPSAFPSFPVVEYGLPEARE